MFPTFPTDSIPRVVSHQREREHIVAPPGKLGDYFGTLTTEAKKPVLVYDGDCGICRYWVNYWRGLTCDAVSYRPYQEAAGDYPAISLEEFRHSIQFITPDGEIYAGARAVYTLLRAHFPYGFYLWLYHYLPGVAAVSEWAYSFFSRRRGLLKGLSYLLWGRKLEPPRYDLTSWLFLRCLGLIYFAAFASLAVQIRGLAGAEGLLPLGPYLQGARDYFGAMAFVNFPTLFWISSSDLFLVGSCIAGMVFALCLTANVLTRTALIVLFILWLSLTYAGQVFMQFQWDMLLLECGFLALFLPGRSAIIVWLYRWLAFRFMLLGGIVKIASQDPTWSNLTALTYHFETQPLPNALAWYAHHLPEAVLIALTGATLFIELVLPFFIFLTRNFRFAAAFGFILLQTVIILTGNYNFFNLLTLAFCLFLFDDAALRWLVPKRIRLRVTGDNISRPVSRVNFAVATFIGMVIVAASSAQWHGVFSRTPLPVLTAVARAIAPLNIANVYGPFAVMTTERLEIVIEGSNDNKHWEAYEFKYKPGDPRQRPRWIIPHQPRLDWQMWFAAPSSAEREPWFRQLLLHLLRGTPQVTKLLAHNPFPEAPPKHVRALLYEYRFSNAEELKNEGLWWTREFAGMYHRPVSLK